MALNLANVMLSVLVIFFPKRAHFEKLVRPRSYETSVKTCGRLRLMSHLGGAVED